MSQNNQNNPIFDLEQLNKPINCFIYCEKDLSKKFLFGDISMNCLQYQNNFPVHYRFREVETAYGKEKKVIELNCPLKNSNNFIYSPIRWQEKSVIREMPSIKEKSIPLAAYMHHFLKEFYSQDNTNSIGKNPQNDNFVLDPEKDLDRHILKIIVLLSENELLMRPYTRLEQPEKFDKKAFLVTLSKNIFDVVTKDIEINKRFFKPFVNNILKAANKLAYTGSTNEVLNKNYLTAIEAMLLTYNVVSQFNRENGVNIKLLSDANNKLADLIKNIESYQAKNEIQQKINSEKLFLLLMEFLTFSAILASIAVMVVAFPIGGSVFLGAMLTSGLTSIGLSCCLTLEEICVDDRIRELERQDANLNNNEELKNESPNIVLAKLNLFKETKKLNEKTTEIMTEKTNFVLIKQQNPVGHYQPTDDKMEFKNQGEVDQYMEKNCSFQNK